MKKAFQIAGGALLGATIMACLSGCASDRKQGTAPVISQGSGTVAGARARYIPVDIQTLPGWSQDSMHEVMPALERSCERLLTLPAQTVVGPYALGSTVGDWQPVCARARQLAAGKPTAAQVRTFIAQNFRALKVEDARNGSKGLFTGYYEGTLDVSHTRDAKHRTPVYGLPAGWSRTGEGRADRAAIEKGALDGKAPVMMWASDPVDLFMLQIQGSGVVRYANGTTGRIGYAGDNGKPFVAIGKLMQQRGLGQRYTMPDVRVWLKTNREAGKALMRENPRYVFFRVIKGDGPVGAQGVPLTPGRSLAVDRDHIPLGGLIWVSTRDAHGNTIDRLMVAQDTGGAIKGPVRGDVYWGTGEEALYHAGGMKSPGQAWILLPGKAGTS